MLLRFSLHEKGAAERVEKAVEKVLQKGFRTKDIIPKQKEEDIVLLSCSEMGDELVKVL